LNTGAPERTSERKKVPLSLQGRGGGGMRNTEGGGQERRGERPNLLYRGLSERPNTSLRPGLYGKFQKTAKEPENRVTKASKGQYPITIVKIRKKKTQLKKGESAQRRWGFYDTTAEREIRFDDLRGLDDGDDFGRKTSSSKGPKQGRKPARGRKAG